jgi:hypothetical protein
MHGQDRCPVLEFIDVCFVVTYQERSKMGVILMVGNREFLEKLKEYIEKAEESIQQNYGKYRTPEEIREAGLMPHIYDEVLERLSE